MKPGKYRHYKGKEYRVLGVARYTIDLEKMVVYQGLYDSQEFGNEPLWVRPLSEFEEVVPYEGKKVERFSFVGE